MMVIGVVYNTYHLATHGFSLEHLGYLLIDVFCLSLNGSLWPDSTN